MVIVLLFNIVIFEVLTYNYGRTVLFEEYLKTISSLGNHSGPGYIKITTLHWKMLNFVGQCYSDETCLSPIW